ncbi:FKBP-type peptidyl-prolyl cis-trans isomerase [Streptomyces sp. N2-109]|uniref:Peptidyl-prolyl cis-trans isomerase n=1 Tax=Streptomyces gossypii TaxID=2883101 RepID=A0ABT2JLE0_9ACTN|nr:FKBP-type peptidyl-prolyl cis-trans isomerase [Streptomyces gossypii]MCT2588705.1 FKBP-type peptidyl-prolyl cis-trans isomerase [Streptomyces gossypii]
MTLSTTARRFAAVLTVPLLIASAAACGSDDSDDDGGKKKAKSVTVPAVSAEDGKTPKIEKGEGDPPKKLQVKVLKEGKGKKVEKGEVLNAAYLGQLWDGTVFDSTWKEGRSPASFQLGTGSVIKGWDEALVGKRLGSRVEMVIPPEKGYGAEGKPPQIPQNSTLVFVVDLKKTMPSQIDGKPVKGEPNADLPKVGTKIEDKAPEIEIDKGAKAPKKLTSETIIEGDGKEVDAKSTVLANFAAKLWDGKDFANTWEQGGPQEFPVSQIPGWKDGLKGAKAGSRVVISVPEKDFPKEQRAQFKSGIVFSVDVLSVN